MDQASLESSLADLHLPGARFFDRLDSTNDEAWRWVERGAPDRAFVLADEQTAGRGRLQRRWVTQAGSGLAFSLVLLSPPLEARLLPRLSGLGALAACQALQNLYALPAQVKWPNDILLERRKAGGVLVETRWRGPDLLAAVIGIGINISTASLDPQLLPPRQLTFPAACVEGVLGYPVDRLTFLHALLEEFFRWLPRLASDEFIQAWQASLAYRHEWVELSSGAEPSVDRAARPQATTGKLLGLADDGSLQLVNASGKGFSAQVGEIHLRPVAPTARGGGSHV